MNQQTKRTEWWYTNRPTGGQTTGLILTSSPPTPSTVHSSSSLSSFCFSVLYIVLSTTFFNVSDLPCPRILSIQSRQIFCSLHQDQYHSYPCTPPDRHGASTKGNPPPNNQQVPQVSQDKNNCKKTPSFYSSDSSNAAAILWPLWPKNPVFFLTEQISLAHKEHLGSPSMR